jgi:thioester reductase-like protein
MKILITGATGFIGKRLAEKFISGENEIYVLVRRKSLDKARQIFEGKPNVHFILGDVSNNDVLDTVGGVETLPDDIESVVHLAALYDLEVSLASAYANNVVGTQNIIYLLQRMKKLKYYHHVSTYAVSGLYDGEFKEEQIESNVEFPDFYARTKMQAEYLVRNAILKNVKVRIYRPGIIIGDSRTGEMDKIDGPYYFLRLFSQLDKFKHLIPLRHLPISCHAGATMPFLPVNTLVDWLYEMISHPTQDKQKCYHLMPDEKILVTDFVNQTLKHYKINMKVQRIPFPQLYASILPHLKIPKELVPYMQSKTKYSKDHMKADFPQLKAPAMKDYLPVILDAAKGMFP